VSYERQIIATEQFTEEQKVLLTAILCDVDPNEYNLPALVDVIMEHPSYQAMMDLAFAAGVRLAYEEAFPLLQETAERAYAVEQKATKHVEFVQGDS